VKHLRQIPHLFVINLAICDLGVMSMNVFAYTGIFYGDTILAHNKVLCEISGTICMLGCFGSLWTMMFVAINRYVAICQNQFYKQLFDLRGTILCIVLIWICVFFLDLPNYPFMNFGGHAFTGLFLHCSFTIDSVRWWFNTLFYTVLALGIPLTVIFFCYWSIWRKATSSGMAGSEKRQREQKQLIISLVTIYVAFCCTWLPYGILIALLGFAIDITAFLPWELIIIIDLWAHFNSAVNFIIYGLTHRGFRSAYFELINKVIPCCKLGEGGEEQQKGVAASAGAQTATSKM